jgi:hypothetical protein
MQQVSSFLVFCVLCGVGPSLPAGGPAQSPAHSAVQTATAPGLDAWEPPAMAGLHAARLQAVKHAVAGSVHAPSGLRKQIISKEGRVFLLSS